MSKPKAPTLYSAVRASSVCPESFVAGSMRLARKKPITPNGTLMANSHGHDAVARISEAAVGPMANATATTSALLPNARPSKCLGYRARSSAVLTLIMALAPTPWNRRATTSDGKDQASAQASDARVNNSMPEINTRR